MIKNKIGYVFMLMMIIISIYVILLINSLGIIPVKYIILISILFLVINIVNVLLVKLKKIFGYVISGIINIILLIIVIIGSIYIDDTNDFLDNAFNNMNKKIVEYNYVVLNNDIYNNVSDLKNKELGYYVSSEDKDKVLVDIKKNNILNKEYDEVFLLYEDLIDSKIDAMLLNSAYMDVLEENNEDLYNNVKVIHSFNIETILESEVEEFKKLRPINIYVSGSDSRSSDIHYYSLSDVNMILTINPNTREILMTSIPRDYYVSIPGITKENGYKDKLTHAGLYGLEASEKTLENLLDIDIDYSVKVNFNAVIEVVDLVGGVDIYSDRTFNSFHIRGWVVKKGMNHMDGRHALAYAKERYAYSSGDRHRILNQQQVLEAVLKKVFTNKELLLKYDELLTSFGNLYRTTIPKEVITMFIKDQINNPTGWTFKSNSLNGTDGWNYNHSFPRTKVYVMNPIDSEVKKAHDLIESTIAS